MGKIKATAKKAAAKVVAAVKQFTSWSYSRYKDHRTCPRFAQWKHLLKKPEGPKSPAMERGGLIHKEGEFYLLGKTDKGRKVSPDAVPASYAGFRKELRELRKAGALAEAKWGMTRDWKVIDFFDWANCWVRLVLDAHHLAGKRARVVDFKTGKVYLEDNLEQMELYSIGALEYYPQAEEAQVELWYLDQPRGMDNPLVKVFTKKQVEALRKKWRSRAVPILMDKRFVPNPNFTCSRCPYSKRKASPDALKRGKAGVDYCQH
jgi:hypothetical protein